MAHDVDIGCVRVSNASLALGVHEECCAWTRALTAAMRELDVAALTSLREDIAAKHAVLQQQPEDLEQLKAVLHVINTIRWVQLTHPRGPVLLTHTRQPPKSWSRPVFSC